jgi:hypothetical protein
MTWTALEVRNKVRQDLDIDEDELVTDTQMYEFINDAVRDMVSEMLKLGIEDKYYETRAPMNIVANQEEYSLPANMYHTKIYRVIHQRSGTREIYEIKRMRGMKEYLDYHWENDYTHSNPTYQYKLLNNTGQPSFLLVPKPQIAETGSVTFWYARKPITVTGGSSIVDIPEEMISYILTFVKVECLKKDVGNPLIDPMMVDLDRIRKLMVDTLTDQTHDSDNMVEMDTSFYGDMV